MSYQRRLFAVIVFFAIAGALRFFVLLHHEPSALGSFDFLAWGAPPTSRFRLAPESHVNRAPRVQTYDFILREDRMAPDGIEKRVLTINGLFPGPTIEVRSGDTLVVNIDNQMSEGTALHWHGLRHEDGSNSQDGAIGVTQCPIPPGQSHTYRFEVADTQFGTFWYHSHHATQRADGLFGAFIVHRPASDDPLRDEIRFRARAIDPPRSVPQALEQVLLIGDWYHRTGDETFAWFQSLKSGGREPVPDIILVNGRQKFDCTRSITPINCTDSEHLRPRLILDSGRENVLRLVNTGSLATVFVSIDKHILEVFEADGTQIEPVLTKELPIIPGQRYTVRPKLSREPRRGDMFWLRHRIDQGEFMYPNAVLDPEPKAVISYGFVSKGTLPSTDKWVLDATEEFDVMSLKPNDLTARVLPPADETMMLYVATMKRNTHGSKPFGYVNQTTWRPNFEAPLLAREDQHLDLAPTEWGTNEFVVSTARNRSQVVDIIVNNLEEGAHPFHLHGHSFWPLYSFESEIGWGSYRWKKPPRLPETAPALRDTFTIPRRGHVVFRVVFDSPGMWMFHCHVLVHMHSGMAMTFNVRSEDDIRVAESQRVREKCQKFLG